MLTADLFCKIVDNYGDASIGWRLARALSRDHGFAVRLFTDDLTPFAALHPGIKMTDAAQTVDDITVIPSPLRGEGQGGGDVTIANLVIDVLAGEVPDDYMQAMAQADKKPVWILYEYLSAEDWIEGTHLKPSPHPRLPLTKYFFYPGFTAQTGGLLAAPYPVPSIWHGTDLKISLFGYENETIGDLITCWAASPLPVQVDVPMGRTLTSINTALNKNLTTGDFYAAGNLILRATPFAPLDDYIAARQNYDLNFVRGEDSLTLCILSGRPVIWQIYPQDGGAHIIKLRAFLARYTANLSPRAAKAVTDLTLAWNGMGDIAAAWNAYVIDFQEISAAAAEFYRQMHQNGNAAQNLVDFYRQNR